MLFYSVIEIVLFIFDADEAFLLNMLNVKLDWSLCSALKSS